MKQDHPTIISISEDEIELDALEKELIRDSTGAIVIFTGVVRGITTIGEKRETKKLEYEAYRPMAEEKMEQVAREMREKWPAVEGIAIIQRTGSLASGTATTVIACSAAHRDSGAFEAARYGIDRLKEIVPVWKKEIGPSGEEWVEGHYHPEPGE